MQKESGGAGIDLLSFLAPPICKEEHRKGAMEIEDQSPKRRLQSGDEKLFGGRIFILLYEQFPDLWMCCEIDNPTAKPRLLCSRDLNDIT